MRINVSKPITFSSQFDAKRLNGVNVSLSGRQFLKEDDDSEVSYELHASKNKALDMVSAQE